MTRRIGELPDIHVNPAVVGARVEALDKGIQALASHAAANALKLGKPFLEALNAFVKRWEIERDSYRDWTARALRVDWGSRLKAFEAHYLDWAKRVERKAQEPSPRTEPAKQKTLADAFVPTEVWWLLGGVAAFYVLTTRRR